ncbi:MAG: LPS export ABC transporter periplasmic protein LptC [Candidatus Poribacteria bacterium]|nr:LPS export ABC transporter periplasmic protein LptC [Candidatus Poribacteria bacterium]
MNVGKRNPRKQFVVDSFQACLLCAVWMGALVLLGIGCGKGEDELTQPAEEIPQQILHKFSTKHTEAGITRWTLVADSAKFLEEIVHVQNPTVQIFQEGRLEITVTGDRGEIIQNDIKVYDNVVGTSQDGVLHTNELYWRNRDGKLYAPNVSRIVRGDSTMVGRELEADPALEVVTMKKTQFQMYPKDEKIDATEN